MEQQIREKIEAAKPEIVERAATEAIKSLQMQLGWQIEQELKDLVAEIFKEDVLPDLRKKLVEQKASIIDEMLNGVADIGVEVSKALVAQATANLQQSWNVSKISDGLFK